MSAGTVFMDHRVWSLGRGQYETGCNVNINKSAERSQKGLPIPLLLHRQQTL
jgi:hypothetical protein